VTADQQPAEPLWWVQAAAQTQREGVRGYRTLLVKAASQAVADPDRHGAGKRAGLRRNALCPGMAPNRSAYVSSLEQAKQSGVQTPDMSSLVLNWTYQVPQHQLSGPERPPRTPTVSTIPRVRRSSTKGSTRQTAAALYQRKVRNHTAFTKGERQHRREGGVRVYTVGSYLAARLSQIIADTTVVVETSDSWFNGMVLKLPDGARFEIEMQWGSIGWSVPATFGYAVAAPHRRVIAMIGDGSFQVTAQEVAQMIWRKLPVIIFLVNNHGYTIEAKIHDGPYNDIKNWDYAGLLKVFNGGEGRELGPRAFTGEELAKTIKLAIANGEGPTLIECVIDRDDCSPQLISWGRLVANANARPPRPQ
jgi:thiamine pyrophosphate-dependent acetolactate synthase large subunit-like protein